MYSCSILTFVDVLDTVDDSGEYGFQVWKARWGGTIRAHRHNDVEVNLIVSGWAEYLMAGVRVRLEPGRLGVFWAATPHHAFGQHPQTEACWLLLPMSWLWKWGAPPELRAALLAGKLLLESESESGDVGAIERWSVMLDRGELPWRRIVELEVEARFRRLFLRGFEPLGPEGGTGKLETPGHGARVIPQRSGDLSESTVEQMAWYLSTRFAEPIKVEDIARHVSLHPSYAMRLFRRQAGMTLIDYLTRQRVAEAQRRLITTSDDVLKIAIDSGFRSASRFHEAFRHQTGTTPGRYRRANALA